MTTSDNSEKRPTESLDYEPVAKFQTHPKPEPAAPEKLDESEQLVNIKTKNETVNHTIASVNKAAKRPMVAHLLRATERFNDRMGNQFGAAITYFSFLSLIPILMGAVAAAGYILASPLHCSKKLSKKSSPTLASQHLPPR